ncbi:MAG: lysophospholipase [Candidatus Palauibacterales bacterium]|nr:lysophospholipase [Candidatus Palauibacterales bacterium]
MRIESTGMLEVAPGTRLFFRSRTSDEARGRLVAVHGLGEHSGRYGRVATCAAVAGLDFHAIDLRGHGRSEGRRGHASSFGRLLADLDHFRRHVERVGSGGPTFLLGHSLGGLVVGRYVQEFGFPDLGGAVLVAPFVDLALRPPAWKVGLSDAADRLFPVLTMSNEIRSSMLFRTAAEAEAYDGAPLVHHRISARLWGEMRRQADVLVRRAGQTRVPVLVQLPGSDRVVSTPAGEDLARRLGGETRLIAYENAYHDLYHDPVADRAAADLVAWLNEHTGGG